MNLRSKILSQLKSSSAQPILVISRHHSAVPIIQDIVQELGFELFHLSGPEIRDKNTLLETLNRTMKFPEYFGKNWDALEECLCDLEWVPAKGYVILYEEPQHLLEGSYAAFTAFIKIFTAVSKEWAKEKVPFHLILINGRIQKGNSAKVTLLM